MGPWSAAVFLCAFTVLHGSDRAAAFDFDDDDDEFEAGSVPPRSTPPSSGGAGKPSRQQGDDVLSLDVEHSLGPPDSPWVPRGKLQFRETKTFSSTAAPKSARFLPVTLSSEETAAMQRLIDTGGYYSLRVPSDISNPDAPFIMASVPACSLAASKFKEKFTIHMDAGSHIYSLGYAVPTNQCGNVKLPNEVQISSVVQVKLPVEGPWPDGNAVEPTYGKPSASAETEVGPDGEERPKEQPGFFRKYWYYIVPAVLMMMTSGTEAPREGAQGGQGGQRASSQTRQ